MTQSWPKQRGAGVSLIFVTFHHLQQWKDRASLRDFPQARKSATVKVQQSAVAASQLEVGDAGPSISCSLGLKGLG